MKKRIMAFVLLLVMVVTAMGNMGAMNKVKAAGGKLIIHYNRADKEYDGWNVWVWPDGIGGKECKFTANDDFGKIAVYNSSADTDKIGLIVRLNEWEKKESDSDRFVTLKDGFAEVWITSGEEEILTSAPDGAKPYDSAKADAESEAAAIAVGSVKVNLHYHRYDNNYEGWNVWAWPEGGDGTANAFTEEDEFGNVASFAIPAVETQKAGFILRLNEWEKKDFDTDRFIDLSKAKDNTVDVYLVQADQEVYYDVSQIDLAPKFLSVRFFTSKEIVFNITVPIDTAAEDAAKYFKVTDESGKEYPILKVWSKELGNVSTASLIMKEKLDLNKAYTITRTDYGSMPVSMGEVFSSDEFNDAFYYDGDDLGTTYTKEKTSFRLWAPTASEVKLNLYKEGLGDNLIKSEIMTKDVKGTWKLEEKSDINGVYYTYSVTVNGTMSEAVDPYARTTGANGDRGMVIDLSTTNPTEWDKVSKPEFVNATDAVIYELHVRDLSSDTSSGIKNVGKFLGLTENGTKNSAGLTTGLDHLIDLGITHLHLLPSFDYATVDETKLEDNQFNWGYDPKNYNVPEGSYSTDPNQGEVRVNEYKQMVQALHQNGIRVVMDVVYNHTSATLDSNFNKIVPDYYYRKNGDTFSNASGCGNETASERAMVRKYIVDSVVYWAEEYKVDGFRFDLMGIHDIETMNAVREALNKVDPTILIYGEGWTGGSSTLAENLRAMKATTYKLNDIAAFSDDLRDGIKGSVFDALDKGFVSGKEGMEESIKFGIVASTENSQIDYTLVNYSKAFWAGAPTQSINYTSAHDNLTLWDKLASSNADDTKEDRIKMNKLSSAIIFTSQGIPFFQAGEELLRSKVKDDGQFDSNSYKSSDAVNSIKWDTKTDNIDVYNYYKGLISFRKAHPALRMTTTEEIQKNLTFIDGLDANVIAYTIANSPNGETAEKIYVIHNANKEAVTVNLPEGTWNVYVNGEIAGTELLNTISDGKAVVEPISCMVLTQGEKKVVDDVNATSDTTVTSDTKATSGEKVTSDAKDSSVIFYVILVALGIAVIAGTIIIVKKKER